MVSITISVGRHTAYSVPMLDLSGIGHDLTIHFSQGTHVYTSPDLKLGTVHAAKGVPLIGRLIFRYTYNTKLPAVIVCDADFESADGMTLMTFPEGMEEAACFERASSAGFAADEIFRDGRWNTRSPLLPGAAQIFKDIARDANHAVIEALRAYAKTHSLGVQVRSMPPAIAREVYETLCLVHQDGKVLGTYEDLRKNKISGPVQLWDVFSQFGGTINYPLNMDYANVIGTTNDPKPPGVTSWIALWNQVFDATATQCSSLNWPNNFPCNTTIVGGHVFDSSAAETVPVGEDGTVYISPICGAHNNTNYTGPMQVQNDYRMVILNNFLQ